MRDLAEERGIEAGYVAVGMATWAESDRTPRAPVLLYSLRIDAVTVAEHDFRLTVDPMPTLNPVLIFKLAREHGVVVDGDELIDDEQATIDPALVFTKLIKAADEVPDFQIAPTRLIGTFSYEKLPMVTDLENAAELLSRSDAVAALAGDRAAGLRLASTASIAADAPDRTAPADEYLVLDADASQSHAINSVLAGQNLVIKGPPGTGKSQTIANLIAALAARGRTTLFVAEKRAAIDAVVGRLADAGLDDLVQNLHSEGTSRRQFAQAMATRLQRISQEILPETAELHRRLTTRRDRLAGHHQSMHARREPWQVTAFEAQQRLMGLAPFATPTRWRGSLLDQLTADKAAQLRDALAELARLGEFAPSRWSEPWARTTLTSSAQVPAAMDAAGRLDHELLPTARAHLQQALDQTGLRPPANLAATRDLISLVEEVQATLTSFRPRIYAGPLDRWLAATAERAERKATMPQLGWSERRAAVREVGSLWLGRGRPAKGTLHGSLLAVRDQLVRWREVAAHPGAIPAVPPALDAARQSLRALDDGLAELAAYLPLSTESITLDALQRMLDTLAADQSGLMRAVRRNELRTAVTPWQTQRLLEELGRRNADAAGAEAAFDHAWLSSILDHVVASDPAYAQFHGDALHAVAVEYADADRGHIGTTAGRVRHAAAAHLVSVLDRHPEQQQLIRKEAAKKARHLPMRELFRRAPEVLTAVKPCWAMSPLLVSQVLPPQRLFDVVIFDEASQVEPTEGITAIMRGNQVVVAGDEHQLPPTRFFDRADAPELVEDDDEGELTADVESLLQAFAAALPMSQVKHLSWHYRSRDERLIAFSNSHIYAPNGNALTTFPGTAAKGSLTHHPGGADEVATVVELILDHARQRPNESLGVITMGLTHAEKIDAALRKAITKLPELHGFFSATSHEPFFVKNIERVQGDERDAIIISVGYGKSADGRMLYRFGPLNIAGGHRRLNVAITRAKRRVTVVSSFSHLEMDPAKLTGDGTRMLKAYLEFAETGSLGGRSDALAPRLTPFETDVRDRLVAAGIPLTVSYGVSGQRIDFVATHPERPEELILAIEADGATYHSGATVRDRERLRKEHLERLGWRFHRIWSTDWSRDPHREVARAVEAYQLALAAAETAAAPVGTIPVPPGTVPGVVSATGPLSLDSEPLAPTLTDLTRQPAGAAGQTATEATAAQAMPVAAGSTATAADLAPAGTPAPAPTAAPAGAPAQEAAAPASPADAHDRRNSSRVGPIEAGPERIRTRQRPDFEPGLPIADYSVGTLVELLAWIESDGRLRTEEDVLDEAIDELGFARRGPRIMAELRSALEMSRQRHRQE
ncbi:very-short-patch-repair endonuclease [Allocatelliglobosispora scoriae]|uniref:Very-short-patch-repair endonuclease n=2 Tax=Allocatelliglobosispora scoriae TaxID=643052 RepID=A0A841BZP6_9ACTN|nr:very-short-patch-repair endonuclease [Allocatelliglobosispora scoriae]